MKIILLTGTAGDIQGWGDMKTTNDLEAVLVGLGHQVEVLFVRHYEELLQRIAQRDFDLVWSSLYHICNDEHFINIPFNTQWVQDYLELHKVPYVGSPASSLKNMLNKHHAYRMLKDNGVAVPKQYYVESLDDLPLLDGQYIVKPCYGSNSTGIDESSIVDTQKALAKKVKYILEELSQPVVVEEYLPGDEYTVIVLGNKNNCSMYSIINKVDGDCYDTYPIVTNDLKSKSGITFIKPSLLLKKSAEALAHQTASALDCRDHVRVDMRMDDSGQLRVIDVNGIPGMSLDRSRSLAIQNIYNPQYTHKKNYARLIDEIVKSSINRYMAEEELAFS